MATYTGPKVRLSRQLGVAISDNPKHLNSRRLDTPPGGSAKRMRRLSDYGVRLREKQKLRYYYNVQEKQFRKYMKKLRAARVILVTTSSKFLSVA